MSYLISKIEMPSHNYIFPRALRLFYPLRVYQKNKCINSITFFFFNAFNDTKIE